jgi:hypothetical protein
VAGGSGQIVEHRLVGRTQPPRQEHPAQSREQPDLGFMADDDGTQAVGRGADRERALGVQPMGVGNEGECVRSIGSHHGAAQLDRVCLPPKGRRSRRATG